MNKIFKVIWNHATQMWIVVSELTKSHGKSTNQTDKRKSLKTTFIGITATGALLFTLPIFANTETLGGGTGNNTCNLSSNKDLACGDATTKAGGVRTNSGKGNIAIGVGSIAQSVNKNTADAGNIAIGHNVKAIGSASVAIGISTGNYGGAKTIAAGADSYAIGNGASTGGYGTPSPERNGGWKQYDTTPEAAANAGNPGALGGIAIGSEAWVMGSSNYGIAIGDNATARGLHAMAYGRIAYAKGNYTIAMGTSSNASGENSLALGKNTHTSGQNALSLGSHTKASGNQSIAIGGSSSGTYAAKASGESSISLGEETNSSNAQAVAIGKRANSSGPQAIALGFESKAANSQAVAIGKSANASAAQAIAIGDDSKSTGTQSIAVGKSAEAKADKAIATGHNVKVESSNAVAVGNNITVSRGFENAVVLGSSSSTQDGKRYSDVKVNDISYSNFAGHNNVGKGDIVSIGNTTHKRQLVNVAPGAMTATSTDAINGSQLYMVADTVANLAKATAAHLGGGSKLSNNNITAPSYQLFTGKSESAQGGNSNTLLNGSPFTNVGDALSGLNTYINKGFNITNNDNATKGVVTPGDTIKFTNGKNTLSNVKQEAGGVTEITFDVENTDLNVNDGKVSVLNNNDGAKFVNATTVAKAINDSSWKIGKAQATNGITFNNTDDEVKAGDEVRFADGKFTTVSVGNKDTNGKTTNVIKVDVDAQKVVEAAQTPVVYTDKDGNKLIKKDNGKFAKTDGTEINPQDVIASINSGGNSTTTPTTLANIKSNLAEDQNGNSSPTLPAQLKKNNAATVSDVLNSGWNLQENGTAKDFVKHGDTVNFANGTGTKVTITKENNGNKIRIDTPLAYVNTDTTDTSTPSNTVKLVGTNNNTPVSLSNLASGLNGQPIEEAAKNNGNNAVNVTDLDTALKAYNFKLGGEATAGEFENLPANSKDDDKQIKKNDTFKLQAGKNIKIKQIPDGYEIATKDQIELGKNDPNGSDGSLNVTSKSGAGVNINGADGSITLTGKPNNGQSPSLKITTEKGQPTINNNPAGGVNRIVYQDGTTKRQVATMDDGLTFAGDFGTDAPRKLGEKLIIKGGETNPNNLSSGNNIGVESNANGTLTAKLAKNLTLGNNNANDGSVGGLAHNLPNPANPNKQDAPTPTPDQHKAATVGDVLNTGFNVRGAKSADGAVEDVDFVKPYDTVEFIDGNATDLIVTASNDNKKTTVKVDIKTDNTTIQVKNDKLSAITSDITSTKQNDGKPTLSATTPTALITAKTVADVANKIIEEGLNFAGNTANTEIKRPLGTKLTIKGEKTDETDVSAKNIYVKADNAKNELVINFSEKPEFKEIKLAETGKSNITLNTTGATDSPALTLTGDNNKSVALKNVAAGTSTLNGQHRGDKANNQNPTTIDTSTPLGNKLSTAYNGLADLINANGTNAFTVADARNLGWVVSAQNNNYAADVRNAHEVRFIGTNMATVTGKTTTDGVREITVDVNAQKVVETAQVPVVYTDSTGKKLIKSPNGKFYPEGTTFGANGEPENNTVQETPAADVIASMNSGAGTTNAPTTLANVKSNLADGSNLASAPAFNTLNKNNAATVEDVLNSGWNLLENGTAKDFVKHGDKVNFINGRGTKVTIGVANGANTIKFDTPLAYVPNDANSTDQSTPTNKVKLVGADENTPVTLANVASGLNNQPLATAVKNNPNNAVNVSDLNSVISDFNFKLGGKATEGGEFSQNNINDCEDGCIKKDETFVLDAGKNIKIKQIANGYEIATKDQITLGSKTENNKEGVDGNLTVTGKDGASVAVDGKDGSITLTGKADNGHTPNVKIGTEKGDKTVVPADVNGIDRIVYTTTENGQTKKRQVATLDDGLVFAGDFGNDSPRKLGEKLTIKGGETQADKLSNNNNIGVVSDGAGNLTIKLAKNLNLGDPNNANNGKISGLAHNLTVPAQNDAQDGPPANVNQHNAATVGDVLNSGWNLQNNGTAKDFVKPYDKVNFVDGANAQLVVTPNAGGTSSDVTVNVVGLPVQYTTKDGTPVAKVGDKYYKVDANGKPITKKDDGSDADDIPADNLITNVIKPGSAPNVKGQPSTLGNVVSALKPYSETDNTTANLPKGGLLDLNTKDANNQPISENNVVTVGDLRKMG